MSGVAMEALTLPAAESQFQPFCGHFYVQSHLRGMMSSLHATFRTKTRQSGCLLLHASNAKYGGLMLEVQGFPSVQSVTSYCSP